MPRPANNVMSESVRNSLINLEDKDEFIDAEIVLQQILDDPSLIQHVTRTEHEDRETFAGYFRLVFEPGQQREILHVPFAPPLKAIPQVQAHAIDQQDVRVRITDQQKFGTRVEVILSRPTESKCKIIVEIVATESQ